MKHLRQYSIIGFCLISVACNSNDQRRTDRENAAKLNGQGADYIMKALQVEMTDSLQAAKYFRLAIDKFLAALSLDPTDEKYSIYLPDLYGKLNQPDSAMYWQKKLH